MQPAAVRVTEVVDPSGMRYVREARTGDVRAFETLVTARLPGAFRLAVAILGNEADAADAAQNALVAAWRELPKLRDVAAFNGWFHRIIVNECRMQIRRNGRSREVPYDADRLDPPGGDTRAAATLTSVEALDLLEGAFEQLDPEDRSMVVLHHLEGWPLAEIAESLHMPVGTVKWRLHEARQVLQHALEVV
jgi:RNA polymerase sigma-70 factor (ECF subfamily)